nr:MAG TPA: putative head-tail adaptor [Caudoviricetes sp.]
MIQRKTQAYNDGVVKIYTVSDGAAPGNMPHDALTLKETLRYKERTVGNQRYYQAMQAGAKVDTVLRCPLRRDVSGQDVAIPNDGKQYKITLVQYPEDAEPPTMDLTLERVTQDYELS